MLFTERYGVVSYGLAVGAFHANFKLHLRELFSGQRRDLARVHASENGCLKLVKRHVCFLWRDKGFFSAAISVRCRNSVSLKIPLIDRRNSPNILHAILKTIISKW